MPHRPLRSTVAALLFGATLLLPGLTGSAASAAEAALRRAAAASMSPLSEPVLRLWQALVRLVQGSPAPVEISAPGSHLRPNAGCGLAPDGNCVQTSPQ